MNIRVEDNNLVDHSDWYAPITGTTAHVIEQIRITASYVSSKNYIENDIGPHGIEVPIWKTQGFATGYTAGIGGTYDTSIPLGTIVDNTKMYRLSLWVNRKDIGTNGLFYFGYYPRVGGSTGNSIRINDGLVSTNFYFVTQNFTQAATTLPENNWVLAVGYLLPSTYTGSTDANYYTKIYNTSGTELINGAQNYKMSGDTTGVFLRCYTPYNETTWSGTTSWLYNPRIDLVDGTEPSIATLLKNEGMWRSGTTYIRVEDQNLLDYSDWSTDLSGSTSEFTALGFNTQLNQYRQLDTDPFGNTNYIWIASGVTTSGETYGGGWISSGVTIDSTNTYRISQWCNRFNSGATGATNNEYFFGFYTYNQNGTITGATRSDDEYNTNYYTYQNNSAYMAGVNGWFLNVGYLMPYTWTGNTTEYQGKIYYNNGLTHTSNAYNYKFNVNAKFLASRVYSPYLAPSYAGTKYAYPRIDLVDGTEPSINTLLNNEGMWRSGTTMIYVDDVWKNT